MSSRVCVGLRELALRGLQIADRVDAVAAVVVFVAVQLRDQSSDPSVDAGDVSVATALAAHAPSRVAAARRPSRAKTCRVVVRYAYRVLLRGDELRARLLHIVDRADAVTAVIVPIVRKLVDGPLETAMDVADIRIAAAVRCSGGGCRGANGEPGGKG